MRPRPVPIGDYLRGLAALCEETADCPWSFPDFLRIPDRGAILGPGAAQRRLRAVAASPALDVRVSITACLTPRK